MKRLDGQNRPADLPLRRQAEIAALVAVLVLGLMGAFAVLGRTVDVPYSVFTKEVVEQVGAPSYTGFLAHITWFLWAAAATAGLLTAILLWRLNARDRRVLFFLAASALTAVLLLDDFAMLHEQVMPRLGIPEEALYAFYAACLVALLVWFRPQFAAGGALLAVAAGSFWALSLGADFVQEHVGIHAHFIEDGAKMTGTALWAAFMLTSAGRTLLGEARKERAGDARIVHIQASRGQQDTEAAGSASATSRSATSQG